MNKLRPLGIDRRRLRGLIPLVAAFVVAPFCGDGFAQEESPKGTPTVRFLRDLVPDGKLITRDDLDPPISADEPGPVIFLREIIGQGSVNSGTDSGAFDSETPGTRTPGSRNPDPAVPDPRNPTTPGSRPPRSQSPENRPDVFIPPEQSPDMTGAGDLDDLSPCLARLFNLELALFGAEPGTFFPRQGPWISDRCVPEKAAIAEDIYRQRDLGEIPDALIGVDIVPLQGVLNDVFPESLPLDPRLMTLEKDKHLTETDPRPTDALSSLGEGLAGMGTTRALGEAERLLQRSWLQESLTRGADDPYSQQLLDLLTAVQNAREGARVREAEVRARRDR